MKTRLIALLLPAALAVAILTGCIAASAKQLDAPVQAREPAVTADADVPRTANEPNSTQETAPAAVTQRITAQEAEAIALKHAGIAAEDVRYLRNEFDYDDGIPEYDIEFHMEGLEYEYEIHAESGAILRSHIEQEPMPAAPAPQPAATEPAASRLTKEEAIAIALKEAGLAEEQVIHRRAELDYENGQPVYEIEFHSGEAEYDYDIHAETGAVLSREAEPEKAGKAKASGPSAPAKAPAPQPAATEPASTRLTKEEAIAIALKHAGLAKDQVSRLKAEFDYDDGVPEYDVDFHCDGMEYDYEIHGESGRILSWDKDRDD